MATRLTRTTSASPGPFMNSDELQRRSGEAAELMEGFVRRTGVTSDRAPRRYLWTDAFAVCNFLVLGRRTPEPRYRELATALIAQVHETLGKFRADDARAGWLSGLDEEEGRDHPTVGGLRIGKPRPERGHDEPIDRNAEWDRDGQYFHYLTRWAHALDQAARSEGTPHFERWARELMDTACDRFSYRPEPATATRLYWKMSTDLSRPLVASMGQHDALDGHITCLQLVNRASRPGGTADPMLSWSEALNGIIDRRGLATADPLGLGGLLIDGARLAQLTSRGQARDDGLLSDLLAASLGGLDAYSQQHRADRPAFRRLAFRELGLVIGLRAVPYIDSAIKAAPSAFADSRGLLERLASAYDYAGLADELEAFWQRSDSQRAETWRAHEDINAVMLATALLPGGVLELPADEAS